MAMCKFSMMLCTLFVMILLCERWWWGLETPHQELPVVSERQQYLVLSRTSVLPLTRPHEHCWPRGTALPRWLRGHFNFMSNIRLSCTPCAVLHKLSGRPSQSLTAFHPNSMFSTPFNKNFNQHQKFLSIYFLLYFSANLIMSRIIKVFYIC